MLGVGRIAGVSWGTPVPTREPRPIGPDLPHRHPRFVPERSGDVFSTPTTSPEGAVSVKRHAAVLAAAVVALAACGDGGGEPAEPTPTPTVAEVKPTEEATDAPADDGAGQDDRLETEDYQVQSGDTLGAIAQRYDTTVRRLVRLNDLDNPNEIRAGQTLKVPARD
jgi:nucleoid-associated protein YgaU